ncbi:hypothetical protein ACFLYB_02895 [Chloroflexota bacterium]
MKTMRSTAFWGIAVVTLSSFIILASCTPAIDANTIIATTAPPTTTTAPPTNTTTPPTTTTAPPTTTTTPPTTMIVTTTTVKQKDVYIPVVGTEFPLFNREQDKWIIMQFDYNTIRDQASDWQFPWSLTIKNKTETDLELTAYIVYVGYHEWVGYVTKTPFELKGGEIKTLSGEDILADALVEQIAYIREAILVPYVVER